MVTSTLVQAAKWAVPFRRGPTLLARGTGRRGSPSTALGRRWLGGTSASGAPLRERSSLAVVPTLKIKERSA